MSIPQHPVADPAVVPLPPALQPAPADATAPRAGAPRSALLLNVLVLALAFLAASFLARNSDLWFHLAAGRRIAQGQFPRGDDPFSYTTGGVYWVNHAWLFDVGLYVLYVRLGGAALVVLKALLVAALAGLLLAVRRPAAPGERKEGAGATWLPVVCTTLAVLAMSPRLLLQPACASYFLLALTFWLLWRPHAQSAARGSGAPAKGYWPLLVVLALWANVDEWFLLGPVLVALFWLGERLEGQRVTPGWLVPAAFVACLVNPHTYHVFTLPADLSPVTWAGGLRDDPRFQAQFASPWQIVYLREAGRSPAVLAYFALTALGLLSFLLCRPARRGWRLVVWLPFGLLAAWQARTIPLFAVVAAPITALNWQDFLAGRAERKRGLAVSLFLRPSLLPLPLLALLVLAWPGWLAEFGREDRHVAWGIQADPSLQRATEALHEWRREGLLAGDERVFALSPEAAQYASWFAPDAGQFFDHRYPLFAGTARDYETVCQALGPNPIGGQSSAEGDRWRQVLRDNGVRVVVLHDREPSRLLASLGRLLNRKPGEPDEWTVLQVAGQAVLLGWNDSRPAGAFAPLALDADRLAFGPRDDKAKPALPAAADKGPGRLPPRRSLWARLARRPGPPSWESPAATVYLHYFDDTESQQREREHDRLTRGYAASLVGLPALPGGLPQAVGQLVASQALVFPRDVSAQFLVRDQLGPFFGPLVERQAALPLLAVRAARRAVAANPEDSNAWLRLGQAYLLLRNATCERSAEGVVPPLAQLRHVQIAAALEEAARLDPDLEAAHRELTLLYGDRAYFDQALEHRREELRLTRRAGPRPGESAEEFADRLELLEKDTAKLVELVEDRRKKYESGYRALQGERVPQAQYALQLGLAKKATDDILLSSPASLLGVGGIKLQLELMLLLGRADEVGEGLEEMKADKGKLPPHDLSPPLDGAGKPLYGAPYRWPAYVWLRLLQASAVGDYAEAQEQLGIIRGGLRAQHEQVRQRLKATENAEWTTLPQLLAGPPGFLPAIGAQGLVRFLDQRAAMQAAERILRAQEADVCVLVGLLALEQGATAQARSAFADALQLTEPQGGASTPFAGRPVAVYYLGKHIATH